MDLVGVKGEQPDVTNKKKGVRQAWDVTISYTLTDVVSRNLRILQPQVLDFKHYHFGQHFRLWLIPWHYKFSTLSFIPCFFPHNNQSVLLYHHHMNIQEAMADDEWLQFYELQREAESAVPKPIRRRSRASRKTPTTLLSANANNFRELVQHFTGCPTSLVERRGPVNLNFGLKNVTPITDGPFQSSPLAVLQRPQQPYYNMVPHHQHYSCTTTTFNDDISTPVLMQDDLSIPDFATSDCILRT